MRKQGAGSRERIGGFTLVEVIVVVAILGVIFGVVGLTMSTLRTLRESAWVRELRRARADAIRTGIPVRAVRNGSLVPAPLFLPDGRAIGSGVDPLTGTPLDAPR